jgi:hypothetical protein
MTSITLNSKNYLISLTIAVLLMGTANAGQPPDSVKSDSSGNTAMGLDALFELSAPNCGEESACYNTGAGAGSLYAITSGFANSAFGFQTLNNIRTGSQNTAVGYRALLSNQDDGGNTAIGANAMSQGAGGGANSAVGAQALYENSSGSYNTAVGLSALYENTSGSYNTVSGALALPGNTTGSNNSAFGFGAMDQNTNGAENVAIGNFALSSNRSGSHNIAVGYESGQFISGSNNIDIGSGGAANENGIVRIGTPGTQTTVYIAGIESTKVTGNAVYVTSSGKLGVLASSERYKTAIESMGSNTEKLQQLRPVTFHLKNDPTGAVQYGLIAEEVNKVYPELVIRDEKGVIQGVRYDELAPMLLNEIKKQHLKMGEIQREVAELKELNLSTLRAMARLMDNDHRVAMQ